MTGRILSSFRHRTDGGLAAMGGIMFGLLLVATAGVIDLSNAMEIDSKMQRISDRSTLIAARNYRDTRDLEKARQSAIDFMKFEMKNFENVSYQYDLDIKENKKAGIITATNSMTASVKPFMLHLVMPKNVEVKADSETTVAEKPSNLYLVLLIDATGSMMSLIEGVQQAALDLEQEIRDNLAARDIPLDRIYVKAAFYGDLRLDPSPEGWIESPHFNLGNATEAQAFKDFVDARVTYFGYDTPESAPAAIAHFVTEPLPANLDPDNTIQAIIAWTDAPGLPLDDATRADDVTVKLYKAQGELGTEGTYNSDDVYYDYSQMASYRYDENAQFDGDAQGGKSNSNYGCCSSLAVMEDRWRNHGSVKLNNRLLGLIVPSLEQPWTEMANWPNVTVKDYTTPTAAGILDDVLDTLTMQYSPLVVSR